MCIRSSQRLGGCVVSVLLGLVFVLGVSADPSPTPDADLPGYQTVTETVGHGAEPTERQIALERIEPQQRMGETFRDCPTCPQMVVVPGGTFLMGAADDDPEGYWTERPQHRVMVPSFAVGKHEVTFAEWDACVNGGRCHGYRPDDEGWGRGQRSVMFVSWEDAQAYVAWLSEVTGESYRLLSEAEWEYVARAGTTTRYWWGDEIGENRANCRECGSQWDNDQTAPVGSFAPNPFGLYDVHGNVWEWVEDCWHGGYADAPSDGRTWESEDCYERVLRGGSWGSKPRNLLSAERTRIDTDLRNVFIGFRIARSLP